jgi:hypothetical protein
VTSRRAIADAVTERVVDRLEPIEIDQQEREGLSGLMNERHVFDERAAIRQTREGITVGEVQDLSLRLLLPRNIVEGQHRAIVDGLTGDGQDPAVVERMLDERLLAPGHPGPMIRQHPRDAGFVPSIGAAGHIQKRR